MDKKLKSALVALLNEEIIVASWGFSDLSIKDSFFEFHVSGFIYQGKVKVSVKEADFVIVLDNGDTRKCTINNLVHCLDCMIEKNSDYETAIIEWIKS